MSLLRLDKIPPFSDVLQTNFPSIYNASPKCWHRVGRFRIPRMGITRYEFNFLLQSNYHFFWDLAPKPDITAPVNAAAAFPFLFKKYEVEPAVINFGYNAPMWKNWRVSDANPDTPLTKGIVQNFFNAFAQSLQVRSLYLKKKNTPLSWY